MRIGVFTVFMLLIALVGARLVGKPRSDAVNPPARPTGPIAVKGNWMDCNTVTESRHPGDDQLLMVAITEKFTGTLNGSYEGTERNVVHKDGSGIFNGSGVFTGQIGERSGTAVMTYSGSVNTKGDAVANWVLDKGTDDFVRIDGQGTFEGRQLKEAPAGCTDSTSQSAYAGTYSGKVEFAR